MIRDNPVHSPAGGAFPPGKHNHPKQSMTRHFAKFILALFTFFASLCLHAGIYEFFFPWLGAEAKICVTAVDADGKPVENAFREPKSRAQQNVRSVFFAR